MKNFAMILKRKLKKNKGFTLVELLFSMLILMLSTTVIIQCFNLGIGNVIKETRASEAQLLCSALSSSLQNELTYARNIEVKDGKLDTYFSSSRRMGDKSSIIIVDGEIKIQSGSDIYPLVASANYTAKDRAGVGGDGYFLKAYLGDGIVWDSTKGVFNVTVWVDDAGKTELTPDDAKKIALAYSEFSVKPLAGVKQN